VGWTSIFTSTVRREMEVQPTHDGEAPVNTGQNLRPLVSYQSALTLTFAVLTMPSAFYLSPHVQFEMTGSVAGHDGACCKSQHLCGLVSGLSRSGVLKPLAIELRFETGFCTWKLLVSSSGAKPFACPHLRKDFGQQGQA